MTEGKLCYRGGWLCLEVESTDYFQPKRVRQWWRIMQADANIIDLTDCYGSIDTRWGGTFAAFKMGKESYSAWSRDIPIDSHCYETVIEDYPCPKVRKGVETRYRNGRWEKCLKTGWVPA